jgi:transglutaminase-like putative cysteine protease
MDRIKSLVILMLFPAWMHEVSAQEKDLSYYRELYPDASIVYLNRSEDASISAGAKGLVVKLHHSEEFMLLKGAFNTVRKKKIRTSQFVTIRNVKASILSRQGKSARRMDAEISLRSEEGSDETFYSDTKFYYVSFMNAGEGDIISIEYDEDYVEPRFFGSFFISDFSPVMKAKFTVTYPPQVTLRHKLYNNQGLVVKTTRDSTKRKVSLTWEADSVSPLTDEYLDPSYRHKASYVLTTIKAYGQGDSVVRLGGSVQDLYGWYRKLIKNVDISVDPGLKAFTDSLLSGEQSDLGKLRKIYYWVQEKISYLAYEDGLGGYVPREAPVVYRRRFGDCKDMANLIVQLGRAAGLPVYPAWIGTREIAHQVSDFPVPSSFNHLIAVYINASDTVFLDATGKNHPYRLPTSMIQGKEALVGLSEDKFIIARVPWAEAAYSVENDSISLRIVDEANLEGKGYYTLTGYDKIRFSALLERKSYKEQLEALQSVLEKGNNKFRLDTFYVLKHEREGALTLYYRFLIRDYVSKAGDNVFVNLNFLGGYFDRLHLEGRRYPVHFNYNYLLKLSVNLELGTRMKAESVPGNANFANSTAGFKQVYTTGTGTVRFDNEVMISRPCIGQKDLGSLDEFLVQFGRNRSGVVSLTHTVPAKH